MNPKLKEKTLEALSSVLPVTGIVLLASTFLVPLEIGTVVMFLVGAIMLVIGMGLFQLGAEMSMISLGEGIGVQISKTKKVWLIALLGFVMGAIITVAEPDLQVLARQVPSISDKALIWTVAAGVGLFLAVALLRIVCHIRLSTLLIGVYALLIVFSFLVPDNFLAVAFDAGGVTTGPITVPFIMALGAGLASVRTDKDAADDSFGLVALSSAGPILAIMLLGLFFKPNEAAYTVAGVSQVATMRDVVNEFARALPAYAKEVLVSLAPIIAVFFVFQLASRRFHRRSILRALVGFAYTYAGLVLFLCGVSVGFAPVGTLLGRELALGAQRRLLIPLGVIIGYFIVKAEPAIHILNHQIQSVTNGAVSERAMNRCLSVGVAISAGLAMLRVLTGLPLYWIIIPGYILALVLSRFVPPLFVGIAFDSGGVASGPMTTTFLLPLCIGACEAVGGSVMTDAFGAVALVALTPLIAVQIMGVSYQHKLNRSMIATARGLLSSAECDEIIDLEGALDEG